MTIYYLYVKTHNITGLKYLGKTIQDPYKYRGSGKDWIPHLKEHGVDIKTDIVKECLSNEELSYWGRYYSALWNVVNSQDNFGNKIWANIIPETGGGNAGKKGVPAWNKGITGVYTQSEESNTARSKALKGKPGNNGGLAGEKNPMYNKSVTDFMTLAEIDSWKAALKKRTPWNKGKKGSQVPWNKGIKGAQVAWNKGVKKK